MGFTSSTMGSSKRSIYLFFIVLASTDDLTSFIVGMAVGIPGGILLVVALILGILCCVFCCGRRKKSTSVSTLTTRTTPKATEENPDPPPVYSEKESTFD